MSGNMTATHASTRSRVEATSGVAPPRRRVALVTNIPTPYRNPCYREVARLCDLRVLFSAMREPDRDWRFTPADLDFPHEVVPSMALTRHRHRPDLGGMKAAVYTQLSPGIFRALSRFQPEIVVGTAFGPSSMMAMAYARWRRIPFVLWSEGTRHTEANLHYLRLTQRSTMVRRASAFWSNGALSTELLVSYGRSPSQPVMEGMTGIDTRQLRQATEALGVGRLALRERLGFTGTVFLFVGSVIELKGVRQMARAFAEAAAGGPKATLVIAGRGPLSDLLQQSLGGIEGLSLVQLGFVDPARLPELYAAADVFILPTLSDNWSLAVLEAAVAGVPQIFSHYNGGSRDLHAMGAAGTIVDPLDATRLTDAVRAMALEPPARSPADVVAAISDHYSPEWFARRAVLSFEDAIRAVGAGRAGG